MQLLRTNSQDPDFKELVTHLNDDLAERDGPIDHAFYAQFNNIDVLHHVVVAYENEIPLGCGAFKVFDAVTVEIKRMYVIEKARGKGIARKILHALENWAKDESFTICILETGKRQPEAVSLYTNCGYVLRSNYGQYVGIENSLCFEKKIAINK